MSGVPHRVGDIIGIDTTTEQGNKVGPTRHAVQDDADSLVNKDPDAFWDMSLNEGRGGVNSPCSG